MSVDSGIRGIAEIVSDRILERLCNDLNGKVNTWNLH